MPTYEYECESCLLKSEEVRPVAERRGGRCPRCGKSMKLLISRVNFSVKDYFDPTLGPVTGPRQREDRMKELGLVDCDIPPSEIKVPDRYDAILESPEANKAFMEAYERVQH